MADEFNYDESKDRFNERRRSLESFVTDINGILDYYTRVPETEAEERDQRSGMARDLYKVEDRIVRYRSELE